MTTRQHRNFARVANLTPRAWWRLQRRLLCVVVDSMKPRKAIQIIRRRRARGNMVMSLELDRDGALVEVSKQILPLSEIGTGETITYRNGVPFLEVRYVNPLIDSTLVAFQHTRRRRKK